MSAEFPVFILGTLLRATGWPREKGWRRRMVIDSSVLDSSMRAACDLMCGLAVGTPARGLAVLQDIFDERDWERQDLAGLLSDLDRRPHISVLPSPWDVIGPELPSRDGLTEWAFVESDEFLFRFLTACSEILGWALLEPDAGASYLDTVLRGAAAGAPKLRAAGARAADPPPDLAGFFVQCDDSLNDFERQRRPLAPMAPARVNVRALRVRLSLDSA